MTARASVVCKVQQVRVLAQESSFPRAHSVSRRDCCGSIKGTGSHGLEGTNFCLGSSKFSWSGQVLSSFHTRLLQDC